MQNPYLPIPLSKRLREAADNLETDTISLHELIALHGSASLGAFLTILAIPSLVPSMGIGWVLSLGMMAVGLAMLWGHEEVMLPARVRKVTIRRDLAAKLLRWLAKLYSWAEVLTRPRLTLLTQRTAKRWLALKVFILAFIIFLPIPGGNTLPAIPLVILGLALTFHDGFAVVLAIVAGIAALVGTSALIGAMAWAGWQSVLLALDWLNRFMGG